MKRNWGIPDGIKSPYPPGCDWQKPPGCHCREIARAQGCENRCDDSLFEDVGGPSNFAVFCLALFALSMAFLVILIWPAKAADFPVECKMLHQFERSCVGVRAATLVLGRPYAERLAKRCGATDAEIAEARACAARKHVSK